jgi:hypothetical protein
MICRTGHLKQYRIRNGNEPARLLTAASTISMAGAARENAVAGAGQMVII